MRPRPSIQDVISSVFLILLFAFGLGLAVGGAVAGFKLAIFPLDWIIK